jgi:signal transduction histidine kinase
MSADDRARAFDRFYQGGDGARGGFGLGLAIVAESMRALDGRIELESELGAGTTIRLLLPGAELLRP